MAPWFWSVDQATETFRHALLGVHPNYFSVVSPNKTEDFMERVFAYELYHQMRLRFPVKHGEVNNIVIHGEFRKALSFLPNFGNKKTYIPDLVVHQSETIQNNLLAVEIKTSKNPHPEKDVLHDLEKLSFYAKSLHFKITAMVLVNSRFEYSYFKDSIVRRKIDLLMKSCGRLRVWNIAEPTEKSLSDVDQETGRELDPACLRIIDFQGLRTLSPD